MHTHGTDLLSCTESVNACILSFLSVADSWLANVETTFANGSRACLSRRATVSN